MIPEQVKKLLKRRISDDLLYAILLCARNGFLTKEDFSPRFLFHKKYEGFFEERDGRFLLTQKGKDVLDDFYFTLLLFNFKKKPTGVVVKKLLTVKVLILAETLSYVDVRRCEKFIGTPTSQGISDYADALHWYASYGFLRKRRGRGYEITEKGRLALQNFFFIVWKARRSGASPASEVFEENMPQL
ncbi:hypothetical protein B9Q02_12070 [Candidatus Marsarchaeota G1 archaeon BE_D]|jgi:hypothetical protein|uniref:Uncharacterized protein n=1 Tax=Candidatus Marsarchaeota G1 archaeon BE_D TaxID=1978156 RepID=A0A2R6A743_9ARCH|nr:MAG: hypothetical protein B9Q02_12070 [Candidatus Marsarchaeota G1 archaeon BE_D]